jgi:methylated-DNA-[protein]-cysteine S-methyltransferase
MTLPTFNQRVYALCRKIPKGNVATYKEIATALNTKAYRAVGNALNKNAHSYNDGGDIPCHRVVNTSGKVGGFAFGKEEKIKLLSNEGIEIKNGKIVNFKEKFTYKNNPKYQVCVFE